MANNFMKSPLDALIEQSASADTSSPSTPATPETPAIETRHPSRSMRSNGLMPPSNLQPIFEAAAAETGVPLNVLTALAQQESRYNPNAIGTMTQWGRAKGLMQNLDDTARGLGINPFDAEQSIYAAARQLRERLDNGYSMEDAVKEHFAGPDRKKWGPKTAAYGREVMEKAGAIGQNYLSQAQAAQPEQPAYDFNAIQTELDAKEPGRYRVLTAEEASKISAGAKPTDLPSTTPAATGQTTTPTSSSEQTGSDGFLSATGKALQNVPQNLKNSAGGLIRSFGEGIDDQSLVSNAQRLGVLKRMQERGDIVMKPQGLSGVPQPFLKDGKFGGTAEIAAYIRANADQLLSPEEAAGLVGMQPNAVSQFGKEVSDQARKDMIEINPDGPLAKYGSMIIGSTAEMLPALTASVLTRSPGPAMSIMGGQVYGQSYDKAREKGMNPAEAGGYAAAQAAAEAIPMAMPLHVILAPGQQFFKGILKAGAAESLQESVTSAIQAGIDKGTLDPNMTWGQALEQIRDGAIVGFGSGAMMRGGVHGVEKLTGRGTATPGAEAADTTPQAEAQATPGERVEPTITEPAAQPAPVEASPQPAPVQEAPQPVPAPAAPPAGPLTRSAQAADPAEVERIQQQAIQEAEQGQQQTQEQAEVEQPQGEPVTVRDETGEMAGTLVDYQEDGAGNWIARVQADDGNTYDFTQDDGVTLGRAATPTQATEVQDVQQAAVQNGPIAEATPENAGPAVTPEPGARLELATATEPQLRAELRNVAAQLRTDRTNAELKARRKEVETAINNLGRQPQQPQVTAAQEIAANDNATAQAPAEQAMAGEKINRAWTRFAPETGTLDVPRAEMPQIKAEHRGAMVNFMEARGVPATQEEVPASSLKPTQQEFSPAKVKKAKGFNGGDRSILVSADGHVLDGHHQWMAKLDGDQPIKVIRLDAPIGQLLDLAREFPSSTQANGATQVTAQPQPATETKPAETATEPAKTETPAPKTEVRPIKPLTPDLKGLRDLPKHQQARAKKAAWAKAVRDTLGLAEGDKFMPTGAVGYATAGDTYTINSINGDGTIYVSSDKGSTNLSRSEIDRARRQGVEFNKVEEQQAEPAPEPAKPEPEPKAKPEVSKNTLVTDERAAELRKRLKGKLGQLNSGIDPEVIAIGTELAVYHIERGARTFAAYAKAIASDLDASVQELRPYLRSWYNGARDMLEDSGHSIDGMDSPDTVRAELQKLSAPTGQAAETKASSQEKVAPAPTAQTVTTPGGREFEVRPKVVEANSLVTSNAADGSVNPAYPQELQPRDRSRSASLDQINDIASKLNPRLLGENPSATDGAPIVSAEGVVESGNGRTLAIQQAYARYPEVAARYKAWLKEQGHDVSGMREPVLVRERVTPMDTAELQAYTQESNERTTLAMSSTERAMADAKKIGGILHLYRGGDVSSAANRDFVRGFVNDVVDKSDRGSVMDGDGLLSQDGRRRIEASLLSAAYGDAAIVNDLFESADTDIKSIGGALLDASGDWALMRQEARDGTIPAGVDTTANLMEAVNLVRRARADGRPVYELVNQGDIFAGDLSQTTKDFMSIFYRGDSLSRARGRDKVADALLSYTRQARAAQPGDNLFGDPEVSGDDLLRGVNEKLERQETPASQGSLFGGPGDNAQRAERTGGEGQRPGAEAAGQPSSEREDSVNAPGPRERVERDRQDAGAEQSVDEGSVRDEAERDGRGAGRAGARAGKERDSGQRDQRVPDDGAAAGRKPSDQPVHKPDGQFRPAIGAARDTERPGSSVDSDTGPAVEQQRAERIARTAPADDSSQFDKRLEAQRKAAKVKTKRGDKANIDEALPLLLPPQREDVLKAEIRHANANGILFTNGTGTGKTASGLGVAKRAINDGKPNGIIVVPSDKIASDWVKFAGMMDIPLKQLESTSENGGSGPVITTYANFGANESLAQRDWDWVITDESHYLSSNEAGETTSALDQLRALSGHHDGFYTWVRQSHAKESQALRQAQEAKAEAAKDTSTTAEDLAKLDADESKALKAWQAIEQPARKAWDERWAKQQDLPKVTFLSATPFPYAKNVDYAEGYLFDYVKPADLKKSEGRSGGYNSGSPRDQFFMQHFGYRMRYNKLTAPEAGVDSEVMEQNFNQWLKDNGALSGRRLEVPHDYDRKFAMVDDAIGQKIDEGLKYLREAEDGKYREAYDAVSKQFDYQRRQYLLESIKARAAVPMIKDHMSLGRKVVVFHDFNKGGGFDPFDLNNIIDEKAKEQARQAFAERPDLFRLDLKGLHSPIVTLRQAFPDALFFNGTVPKKQRRENADAFNDDHGDKPLIVVQSDAGREGVSLHDTSGKSQRVLINLGMPGRPVAAIQIEGRTYRTGQASDAIFRYLTTGTGWEASAFASKIAERASTAENLALGSEARGLKQSFVDAYQNADEAPASPEDGKGGKEYDRSLAAGQQLTGFQKAKTFYWAQQKNTRRRDQREGVDYFATPEPVGYKMVEWANINQGDKVLEPSAGHGAIARFFPEQTDVTMVEPSYDLSQRAALSNGSARIVNEQFEDLHLTNKYDAIVMNPPYGSGGKTAIEHLTKAAKHLRNGGRVVALIPRGGLADKRLEAFLTSEDAADLHMVSDITMPPSTFGRAGTSVATHVVVLEKHANPDDAAGIQQRNIDLSNAEDINELFDRIEDLGLPDRKPTSKPEPREEIIEHTTGKGKVLRGVIRHGLTKDQALEIDPYTFTKKDADGKSGWFIRAKYLDGKQSLDAYRGVQADVDGAKFSIQPDGLRALVEAEPLDLSVSPELAAKPLADVRTEAFNNLLANRSTTVSHPALGTITFNRAGITKSRSNSNDPAKVLTMGDLGDIIGEAAYLGNSAPQGDSSSIARFHYLGRRVTVDGEPMMALVTLREGQDGKVSYYNHAMLQDVPSIEAVEAPVAANDNSSYQRPAFRMQRLSLSDGSTATPGQAARVREALTSGPAGKAVERLLDSGRVVLHDTVQTLPGRPVPGTQAMTMPDGTVHLVAENLTPQTATPVMLHEMFHAGAESLVGSQRWGELQQRLGNLYRQFEKSPGKAGEFFQQARQRVQDAQRAGNRMDEALTAEEFGAYAIEQYESAPAAVRKWVDDVIGAIKEFLFRRFGIQLGQVSPAQLRTMAVQALRREAVGARGDVAASITNVTNTPAFKRWFGDSKVVDANGEPRVVFHGAPDVRGIFAEGFKAYSRGSVFFAAADYDVANSYADAKRAFDYQNAEDQVIPLYLSIKNPMIIDAKSQHWRETERHVEEAKAAGHDGIIINNSVDYYNNPKGRGKTTTVYAWFEPTQAKSAVEGQLISRVDRLPIAGAVGNNGEFDPSNPDIRYSVKPSQHFKDLTAEQKSFLDKIGPERLPQKMRDRWNQLTDNLALRVRQAGVDRYAALLRNDKALYGDDTLDGSIASSAWVLARMSPAAGGAVSALLNNGRIYLDGKEKVIDIKEGTEGLGATLRKLGDPQEIDRFMGWIAANRSKRLAAEGRENLFTPEEIEAGIKLSGGKLANGKSRSMLYAQAWKEFQQHRDDVLGIAEATGIITPEQRQTWAEEFYVPFYRVMDEDSVGGPSSGSGLSRQQAYKKLKGGKQHLNDLLDNTLLNFHHLLQASLKNQAAAQAMANAEALGIAKKTTEARRDKKMSTFVMEGGEKQWYDVGDALTFKAISALADAGLNNPAMRIGRAFKRFFTNMTTITPQFVVANTIRDTLSAMATSPTSAIPLKSAIKGALTYGNDKAKARMMASGGAFSFGHVYGQNANEIKASMTGTMRNAKVLSDPKLIPQTLLSAWRKYHAVTDFAENINRAGIWEQNLDRGKLKAAFEARDLMDFSAHGDAAIVRILTDLVPFLNARIQGLDKLYRSGAKPAIKTLFGKGAASDKQAFARFAAVTGALLLASVALYLRNRDDEEYRKLEDWQRDTYWVLRFGENMFFIPKPFEVGSIATMGERLAEQFTDPTVGGEKFATRLGHMLTDTFAFNPIPQAVKPLYELGANENTFTGRPIEDQSMQKLSPSLRSRPETSRLADAASRGIESALSLVGGKSAALSPVQIDHLIQGYTGAAGATAVGLADTLWRTASGEQLPARRWSEYQPVKRFYKDLTQEDNYTRYGTDFYDALKKASEAYADLQFLVKYGEEARADELSGKKADELAMYKSLNKVSRSLSQVNAQMKIIQRDKSMSAEAKRLELDRLRGMRNLITEEVGKDLEQQRVAKRAASDKQ